MCEFFREKVMMVVTSVVSAMTLWVPLQAKGAEMRNPASTIVNTTQNRPANTGAKAAFSVFKDCDVCPSMIMLPQGNYLTGSHPLTIMKELGRKGDTPWSVVNLPYRLAIGRAMVSVGEWKAFVRATKYEPGKNRVESADCEGFDTTNFEQADDHPQVCVTREDVAAYIKWLSRRTQGNYRFVTDGEWEIAHRAGSSARYYTGEGGIMHHYFKEAYSKRIRTDMADRWEAYQTWPSTTLPPNRFGFLDMMASGQEWIADDSSRGGSAASEPKLFIVRGCLRREFPCDVEHRQRIGNGASARVGFRVARQY